MKTAVLVLLSFLVVAAPVTSQPSDDKLIVPGGRIGKWTLLMAIDDLVRMNGPAQTLSEPDRDFARKITEFHWQQPGLFLTAITFEDRSLVVLRLNEAPLARYEYKTDRGISFQSARPEILKAYGQPTITKRNGTLDMLDMIY